MRDTAAWIHPPCDRQLWASSFVLCVPHLARSLINTWYVDFRCELDSGRGIWVAVAAVNVDAVDPILMDALVPLRQYTLQRH